jgi:hypothetical protein
MSGDHGADRPVLFISHKHRDSTIADVIRSFVTMSSGGRVAVFQSSSAWADAPKAGRSLNRQLRETLWKTAVVILIHTTQDDDWTYCMWECGVALNPASPDTSVVLFECSGAAPALFSDEVYVDARKLVDIQKFADDFLTSPEFFPQLGGPVTAFARHGHEVASAAAELFQKLQPLLPSQEELEEWPAYPFIQFELAFREVELIRNAEAASNPQIACNIIATGAVISAADKYAERLFSVPSFPSRMSLERLADLCRQKSPTTPSEWAESLCLQIADGAMWRFPRRPSQFMAAVNDGALYLPVLNRVRRLPSKQCMQFDVYFYARDILQCS